MKANKSLNMKQNTKAQVGIGTLIIFIAMVLVAAVAAAVLIQTSGILQQKAQSTGKQSTQEVSSNLMVKNIEGVRATDGGSNVSSTIDMLKLQVGLNVGSSPVDVNQVVVSITDGSIAHNLVYAGNDKTYSTGSMASFDDVADDNLKRLLTVAGNPTKFYTVDRIRDEDQSFSQANPVMNTGDLIIVYISATSAGAVSSSYDYMGSLDAGAALVSSSLDLVPRTTVNIVLTPESGAATIAEFVTPSSYGVKETVQLYP
ncbi:archaellin/type IV pilin N-terminal domain-containing protein [Methanolobus mangrovi]|uniref:Flagellin n=1 Tax=Methanolobus mangrovi TaxID=3072977 RepID=A0AA51UHA4_9EURY|nr:archaellin/type IV pilin N-terminal domain-containing protein [Methanolobus mangrovi]WMW23175.1 archaellin/type IV pilin N-terminal domain-containing protein [Methanolobus mangrovi]